MKKAQMEILGLVVVLVLLTVGLLFVVKFILLSENADVRGEYAKSYIASNFLNSLLQLTVEDCGDIKMSEILADAAGSGDISCSGDSSFDFVHDTIQDILDETLNEWDYDYYLYFEDEGGNIVSDGSGKELAYGSPCSERKQQKNLIQSGSKTYSLIIDMCN